MAYVNKYKGFIIPAKDLAIPEGTTKGTIVVTNPTIKQTLDTAVLVEDYVRYTEDEYKNFVVWVKAHIDNFMEEYEKKQDEEYYHKRRH